jgi:gluconokinase
MPASATRPAQGPAIVVMGVSGSGKTSVGEKMAESLGLPFGDADSFHPKANIDKMSSGIALTDEDRWPWLDAIGAALRDAPKGMVVTCSALKRIYRERLNKATGRPVIFIFLDGPQAVIAKRMGGRRGHFMPASLLDSQFATLEPPAPDELAVRISVEPPVETVVANALAALPAAEARAAATSG